MANTQGPDNIDSKLSEKNTIVLPDHQKKISYLKKRIFLGALIFIVLGIITFLIISYYLELKKTNDDQIGKIASYITNLQRKSSDIKLKATDVQKYKDIWKSSKEGRKTFDGININKINTIFADLSTKYSISNPAIKILVPEILKDGVYNRTSLDVLLSQSTLSFDALTDVSAISFIKDFIDNIPGYVVITNFAIKKTVESGYKASDLIDISLGKPTGIINVKMEFSWYVLKKKNPDIKIAK